MFLKNCRWNDYSYTKSFCAIRCGHLLVDFRLALCGIGRRGQLYLSLWKYCDVTRIFWLHRCFTGHPSLFTWRREELSVQGPSHLIISWFAAEAAGLKSPRDRRIVALSGLAPDIDVLAYLGGIVYFGFDKNLAFEHVWQIVHHRYTHGLGFILLTGIIAFIVASRGTRPGELAYRQAAGVAILSMITSMVHVFCDVVGGGPTWPVYPLWPISDFGWAVSWSWTLADWPNTVILFSCLIGMMLYAKISGCSPMESINYNLDRWFVTIIQRGSSISSDEVHNAEFISARNRRMMRIRVFIYLFLVLLIIAVFTPLGFQTDQLNLPQFWVCEIKDKYRNITKHLYLTVRFQYKADI